MKHLHYRLSIAMLAIIVLLGTAFYVIDRYSVQIYYEELSQRLNASLAMYVVNAEPLVSDGEVNHDTLAELANRAMVINPTAEIYLLGPTGNILSHALPPDDVLLQSVAMDPIQDLLAGSSALPIKGPDPRDPSTRKVFSVFPVTDEHGGEEIVAYLYVVLGGSNYKAVANQVSGSDVQRMIAATILLLVFTAFIAGTLLFSFLTRRLRLLTSEVTDFTAGNFAAGKPKKAARKQQDEIDQLRNACHYMADTIQEQVSSLKENDRLRRELVTNISHDLRTPLTTMQGYIETLIIKDETLDRQTRQQYLEIARKHAAHLGKLIQDLFELATLDSSRVTPSFEHFSLSELIHDVVQEFGLQARHNDISLHIDPPGQAIAVYADISLIQRVLENLVGNALKYTPRGGKVSISVQQSTDGVDVSVADNGPGISKEDLPYIFDRFYKADQANSNEKGSMGLGLAIAKRILELHGSDIVVISEELHGTQFKFDLPLEARAA
jgi:signal transduction histidine kinase